MLLIVHVVRERPSVSSVTQSSSGAVTGARPGTRPVSGARSWDGQGAGVHCAVENISESRIIASRATTCYLLVLLKCQDKYAFCTMYLSKKEQNSY